MWWLFLLSLVALVVFVFCMLISGQGQDRE